MKARLARLLAELRADRQACVRHLDELAGLALGDTTLPGDLTRAAWALHHAYTSVESILSRCARVLEGATPTGPDWHRALLEGAALALPTVRPPLLKPQTVRLLHELRAFRHFVRHAYAIELDEGHLARLQDVAGRLAVPLGADLDALEGMVEALLAQVSAEG